MFCITCNSFKFSPWANKSFSLVMAKSLTLDETLLCYSKPKNSNS